MAKVLGIGGVFFKGKDPAALSLWYEKYLGFKIDAATNSHMFSPGNMPERSGTVWSVFPEDTPYLNPSDRPFMVNFVVDDIYEALAQVTDGGGRQIDDVVIESYGAFGWFVDPEGNKVELWQPTLTQTADDE
ncbi:MAG: VOC family protein [Pseudomonadota bacterium]